MSNARQTEHPIDPLFTRRWSPRALTGEAIPEATLLSLLEAARWAPSSFNAQPWRFAWVRRETPGWPVVFDTLIEFNRGWAQRAAALVVVLSRSQWTPPGQTTPQPSRTHAFDAGAAWAHLALQATLSGWAAHGMAGFDHERLRLALKLPDVLHINAVIAIGRAGDKSLLPEPLQSREVPSDRLPLAHVAAEVTGDGAFALVS